jgi:3-oxoacyl-(acyl-carrier-protein) synthase
MASALAAGARGGSRIALRGLGSISAFGASRQSVSRAYAEPEPRLVLRDFGGGASLPCGALSAATEQELAGFLSTRPRLRGLDRSVHFGVFAAHAAAEEAFHGALPARIGVALGSSRGATGLLEQGMSRFHAGTELSPSTSPTTTLGNLSSWVAQELSPAAVAAPELSSTCSSSFSALGVAIAFLRSNMADAFLTGGTEAPLTPFTIAQMRALGVHSCSTGAIPCRPCASERIERNCMVLGEGAAVLALDRGPVEGGARGLAWISGIGFAVEPITSKTSIHPDGLGLRLSMQRALDDAGGPVPDVVITHTPGTEQGDRAEITALSHVFGDRVPYLTSNKWLIGHTLGASAALSVEYAVLLLSGLRPAVYPYRTPFETPPPATIRRALVNSIGFGGTAASVIVDRWE